MTGEDGGSDPGDDSAKSIGGDEEGGEGTPDGQPEEDDSSSSEESKDLKANATTGPSTNRRSSSGNSSTNNDEGEVSSVTTRKSKTERNHYILRMAIDEKFSPRSVRNLRSAAYLVFFILLALAVVYYVIQISLYEKIKQNIQNIHNSE